MWIQTSGLGKAAQVPREIKKWNWGAFFANWIWGIGNRTYSALLTLIPLVGWIYAFVLGVKGSEWAWQNKRWKSVDHFKKVQRIWAIVGLIYFIICFSGTIMILSNSQPGPTESAAQAPLDENDDKDKRNTVPKKVNDTKDQSTPAMNEPRKTYPSPAKDDKETPAANPPASKSIPSTETKLKYDPHGQDRDCKDFSSQEEAQAFFEAAGPGDPHRLDRDKDGIACNSN